MALEKSGLELVAEGSSEFFSALDKAEKAVNEFANATDDGAKRSSKGFSAIEDAAKGLGSSVGRGADAARSALDPLVTAAGNVGQAFADADKRAGEAFRNIASGVATAGLAGIAVAAGTAATAIFTAGENAKIIKASLGDLPIDQLQAVDRAASLLAARYGVDLNEAVSAASTLQKEFGLSAEEAMNFVSAGFDKGLNASDDFLDTIGEYSNQFGGIGASADEFFSVLETGLAGGMLGTDKAADAFKEYGIRILDGSETTKAALEGLGLDQVLAGIKDGTLTAIDAFPQIQAALAGIEDPIKQAQLGVALFGTQWEDLGASAVLGIDTTKASMEGLAATSEAAFQRIDSLSEIPGRVFGAITTAALPASEALLEVVNSIMDAGPASDEAKQAIGALAQTLGLSKEQAAQLSSAFQDTAAYFSGPFQADFARGVAVVEAKLTELGASPFGQTLQAGAQVAAAYFTGPFVGDFQAGLAKVGGFLDEIGADDWWAQVQLNAGKIGTYILNDWPQDFQQGTDKVVKFFGELPGKIVAMAGEFTSAATDIGGNIIDGVVQGLENAAGGLFSAIRGIIDSALGAAESEAEISSPSKRFADEVGQPIVAGVAKGIEDNLDLLRQAAAAMGVPFQEEFDAIAENVQAILDGLYADLLQGTSDFVRGQVSALSALDGLREGNADDSGLSDAQKQMAAVDTDYEKALKKNSGLIEKVAQKEQALIKERQRLASDGIAKRGKLEDDWNAKSNAALAKEKEARDKLAALRTDGGSVAQIASAEQALAKATADQVAIEAGRTQARTAFVQEQTAKSAALDAREKALWAERQTLQQQTAVNNAAFDAARTEAAATLKIATDRKAQIDAIADDAEKRTRDAIAASKDIADPRERKLYLDTVTGFIEEESQYKRDILTAESAEERTRLEERLKLVQEAQRTEAEIYARGAEERRREFEIQLTAAQEAARSLGDFVYYSQEDAYGVGSDVAQGIATGLRDQLAGLGELIGTAMEESIKRARELLGIASPSKVSAALIGAPLADGISTGFMDTIAASMGSMGNAARAVITPIANQVSQATNTSQSTNVVNNYQYQPSYNGSPRQPSQDFAAMRALHGGR